MTKRRLVLLVAFGEGLVQPGLPRQNMPGIGRARTFAQSPTIKSAGTNTRTAMTLAGMKRAIQALILSGMRASEH
jgi:hypothetical protein